MEVRVQVPASSANLGPGFDCLGLALGLYNRLAAREADRLCIEIDGDTPFVPRDGSNLVVVAMKRAYAEAGRPFPNLHLHQSDDIPLSRGLGSSAAAIVAGLAAANALLGNPFDQPKLLRMATAIEGHPDNVAACLYGGLTAAVAQDGDVLCVRALPSPRYAFAALLPDYDLPTRKARAVLPARYSKADAVFNVGHAVLMYAALEQGRDDVLRRACEDRLHQNYRKALIPGWDDVLSLAWRVGALSVFLSGAGPTILAVYPAADALFVPRLAEGFTQGALKWRALALRCSAEGARVL